MRTSVPTLPLAALAAALLLGAAGVPALAQGPTEDPPASARLGGMVRIAGDGVRAEGVGTASEAAYLMEQVEAHSDGYVYAPSFVQYHIGANGALVQSYVRSPYLLGNTTPWGYVTQATIFPGHCVQLRAGSERQETHTLYYTTGSLNLGAIARSIHYAGIEIDPWNTRRLVLSADYRNEAFTSQGLSPRRDAARNHFDAQVTHRAAGLSETTGHYTYDDYVDLDSRQGAEAHRADLLNRLTPTKWLEFETSASGTHVRPNVATDSYFDLGAREAVTTWILPMNDPVSSLSSLTSYEFRHRGGSTDEDKHVASEGLTHTLYRSLITNAAGIYSRSDYGSGSSEAYGGNGSVTYHKLTPGGFVDLGYAFSFTRTTNENIGSIQVRRETRVLSGGTVVLLANPNVVPGSVVVTDAAGTLRYQENVDYGLAPRGSNVEIFRIPTGALPDGATVYVDYVFSVPQQTTFDTTNHGLHATWNVSILTPYYAVGLTEQTLVRGPTSGLLDDRSFSQTAGCRLDWSADIVNVMLVGEYRDVDSRLTPYWSTTASAHLDANPLGWFKVGATAADLRTTFRRGGTVRTDSIRGTLSTMFLGTGNLRFELGYEQTRGRDLDRDLAVFNAHADYVFRGLFFNADLTHEFGDYRGADYSNSRFTFSVERRF